MTELAALFPGIPLVESPIFGSLVGNLGLDDEERSIAESLNHKGYAVFDFPDPNLDERIDDIRARLAPEFGIHDNDFSALKTNTSGRIQDAWQYDDDVRAIAANEAVIRLLSKLWGRRAFPFQTLNFPVGTQQHVHTDAVHFSSVPERFMCGVWLAMEDIYSDSGPLFYVPGSHRWPIISNTMIGRRGWQQDVKSAQDPYHEAWNALIAEHQIPSETFLARKGQALIWCANLLHGGSPQTNPTRTRWSQVTHYFFDDCVYYTPALSDEPLGRLALRNLVSVADGTHKPNVYLGEQFHAPGPADEPPRRSVWKAIKQLLHPLAVAKVESTMADNR